MSTPKGGKAIIIVGGTGSGKSHFNKNMVRQIHPDALYIFDPQDEYGEFYNKPFLDIDEFVRRATPVTINGKLVHPLREMFIVYEEASMVFSNRGYDSNVVKQLVGKRHSLNTYILVFHSLRAVPKYLLDYCNFLVLFKTNDKLSIAENFEHEELLQAYKEIQASDWINTTKPDGTVVKYSSHKIITLLG